MNHRLSLFTVVGIVMLLLSAAPAHSSGKESEIIIDKAPLDGLGFLKQVKVHISGFNSQVDRILKFDLLFMGIVHVPRQQADYLIKGGGSSSRLEVRVSNAHTRGSLLAKAFVGKDPRRRVHAMADAIATRLTQLPGIAQAKITFKVESRGPTGRSRRPQSISEVYIGDFDGKNAQRVTSDKSLIGGPCWVGRSALVYASYKLGNPYIFSHNLTTGARAAVARYPGGSYSPAVSPDGRRVAMILSKSGSPDLYVANIDGSGLKRLSSTRAAEFSPCWSPDGKLICYGSRKDGATRLYTISPSGGAPRRFHTTGAPNPTEPDWSPDGKWVAFTSMSRSGFQICMVRANGGRGGTPEWLVEGEDPSWAPNSRAIIFNKGHDHAKHLSLLDAPTKRVKHLGRILESNSQPSWARKK